jgi:signal peptidase I
MSELMTPDAACRRSRRRRVRLAVLGLASALVVGAGAARTLGQLAGARAYLIPTNSMRPALRPGDLVQADDAGGADPERGEVWVLLGPPELFPGGGPLVERVIGLPGETVEGRPGRVLIDGRPIAEPYLAAPGTYAMPARRLGPGEYFVLGDSRDASNDSHVWGPAPRHQFLGRARLRFWPPGRIGGL